MRLLLFCFLITLPTILLSQQTIKGVVTDQQEETLPFVTILINDSPKNGVTTDIDGRFEIKAAETIKSLTFSYIGFEQLRLTAPFKSSLEVQLKPTAYEFEAVEVIAGENPAHRIIKKVVANRDRNNHEKMDRYECLTYNKMTMGFLPKPTDLDSAYLDRDTTKKRIQKGYRQLKNIHNQFSKHDLMIVESISKRKFQYPKDLQEEVLHNQVSGFKELPLATFATDAQPFTFYEETLPIYMETYLNPISKGSTKKYFFTIEDTLFQQQDTLFIISFRPKKGKNFEGLKGVLYINTNQYAIQNVIAEPSDNQLMSFKIEQKYQWINEEHWFPEQLNFEFYWEDFGPNYMSFLGYGKTYVSAANFHPTFDKNTFKKGEKILFLDKAFETTDSTWQTYRVDSLSQRELATYEVLDSLGEALKFDKWTKRLAALGEGRYPIGPIDWVLRNTIAFNNYEKFRLGIGLSTNRKVSEKFEVGGYYAYGFGDKDWKYGANLSFFFDEYRQHRLDIIYHKDIAVPASINFQLNNNLLTPRFFSTLIDIEETKGFTFRSRPIKYWSTSLSFGQHQLTPTYDYTFVGQEINTTTTFTEVGVNFRYAFDEKFSRFFGYNVYESTNYPIVEFNYTRGLKDFWGGQYDYDKFLFSVEHSFDNRLFGQTSYRLEAGYINQDVPLNRLFTAPGFGSDSNVQLLANSFRIMDPYEFLSDRFVHFYFRQDFGSLLFKTKKIHPQIAIEHNLAFGSLRKPELHQGIDFKTLEKGFFEVGLVVNNILRFNYFNMSYIGLGVGAFYRYGPNALPTFNENKKIQATFTMSF